MDWKDQIAQFISGKYLRFNKFKKDIHACYRDEVQTEISKEELLMTQFEKTSKSKELQVIKLEKQIKKLEDSLSSTSNQNKNKIAELSSELTKKEQEVAKLKEEIYALETIVEHDFEPPHTKAKEYINSLKLTSYIFNNRRDRYVRKKTEGSKKWVHQPMDVRNLIQMGSLPIIKYAQSIYDQYKPKTKQEVLLAVFKQHAKDFNYILDADKYGSIGDFWSNSEETHMTMSDDCLPEDTLLLREDMELIEIKDINVGEKIYGMDGKITKVKNKWEKGKLKVKKIYLSTGSILEATEDHKIFFIDSKVTTPNNIFVKKVSELREGDVLLRPETLERKFTCDHDVDFLKLIGLYIADGWEIHKGLDFAISGKDGFPKEEQKKWVVCYCEANDIPYKWQERYINVKDKELSKMFENFGHGALNKHLTKDLLQLNDDQIEALLEGLKADSAKYGNNNVYGTISRKLATQIRLLTKFLGYNSSLKKYVKHGGLGRNPIYRIRPYIKDFYNKKPVTILKIEDGEAKNVYDIETENNGIYLPEHDIVVHNCESLANHTISVLLNFKHVKTNGNRIEFYPWEAWVQLGFYMNYGHGWVLFWDTKDKCFRVFESTSKYVIKNLSECPKIIKNKEYDMFFMYNNKELRVKKTIIFDKSVEESVMTGKKKSKYEKSIMEELLKIKKKNTTKIDMEEVLEMQKGD